MFTIHTTVCEGAVEVALVEDVGFACALPWKEECLPSCGAVGEAIGFCWKPWKEAACLFVLCGVGMVAGCTTGAVPGEKELLFPYGGAL